MRVKFKFFYVLVLLLLPTLTYAGTSFYYVTQNGKGVKDGKSLANAWSVSDFNNATNWSTSDQSNKIDPGDTVYFFGSNNQPDRTCRKRNQRKVRYYGWSLCDCQCDHGTLDSTSGSINIEAKKYLTIQNFTIDGQNYSGQRNIRVKVRYLDRGL